MTWLPPMPAIFGDALSSVFNDGSIGGVICASFESGGGCEKPAHLLLIDSSGICGSMIGDHCLSGDGSSEVILSDRGKLKYKMLTPELKQLLKYLSFTSISFILLRLASH